MLLTVGHGAADRGRLGELLAGAGVALVVDVRRYPASRSNPDVRREALEGWLPERGVDYRWEPRLGGRRHIRKGDRSRTPGGRWRLSPHTPAAGARRLPDGHLVWDG
ncbi:DUF488 domain-containing protein [Micromonospora okii]|uniref:DUF488 domain-containing protein n=1 Tax=Micromonospora okii TaxID=1182970 RepID=UPI001E47DA2D|nr:DUF488 domain-containing protein [Micromonospora okii]